MIQYRLSTLSCVMHSAEVVERCCRTLLSCSHRRAFFCSLRTHTRVDAPACAPIWRQPFNFAKRKLCRYR